MNDFNDFFKITGLLFCLYCVARIIHSLETYLEDNDLYKFTHKILAFVSIVFYFFSFPVTIVIYLLQKYRISRIVKFSVAEERKKQDTYWKSVLLSERKRYQEKHSLPPISDLMGSEYSVGYDEGYSAGYQDGYSEASAELDEAAP